MFRRRFSRINFLEGLSIFPLFRKSSKVFSEFWREKIGRVVTTALYMYIGTFLGKLLSFRKVQSFFRGFLNLSCKCVDSQRKFFATVVKIALSVAKESFLIKKNKFFQKIVSSTFLEFRKFFCILVNKVTAGLPKIHCACSDEHFGEKLFCWESAQVFHPFQNSSKNFSVFWRQIFHRVVTNRFYMCRSTIWGKIVFLPKISWLLFSFFGIWVTNLWFFGFLEKFFRYRCQNCLVRC